MVEQPEVQFQGDLELISFSDVLQFVAGGRKTGALVIERLDGVTHRVYFDKGAIIAASSSRVDDYLGRILIRRGAVEERSVEEALKHRPPGMKLGDALVSMGLLTKEDVDHFLKEQFRRIIFDTFSWTSGAFRFETGVVPEGGKVAQPMPPDNFILEGFRRLDEAKVIDRGIPQPHVKLAAETTAAAASPESRVEREVLEALRVAMSRADLLKVLRADEFDLRKAIYKLFDAGLIKVAREVKPADPELERKIQGELERVVASYNGIFSLIYQTVQLEVDGAAKPPIESYRSSAPEKSFPILEGMRAVPDGGVDPDPLLANLAKVRLQKRRQTLVEALRHMLGFQLQVVRKRVGAEVATGILEMCSALLP